MTRNEQGMLQLCKRMGERLNTRAPIKSQYDEFWRFARGSQVFPYTVAFMVQLSEWQDRLDAIPDITDEERQLLMAFARGDSLLLAKLAAQ